MGRDGMHPFDRHPPGRPPPNRQAIVAKTSIVIDGRTAEARAPEGIFQSLKG